jgi:hypothetical protein
MLSRRSLTCAIALAGMASFQSLHAQPVRSCPEGQAVNSLNPNGTPVECIPVPPPVNLGPLNAAIAAEAATRAAKDLELLGAIQREAEERKAAIEALQPPEPTGATRCYGTHFVRNNNSELHFTTLFFQNADPSNTAVVERITIRDDIGTIIHDSGPRIGKPHPPALGPIPPLDITNVPPGGTFGWSTTDVFGFATIPSQAGKGLRSLSMTAEISKQGDPKLVTVHARQIVRGLVNLAVLAEERSNNSSTCFSVPRSPVP